MSENIINLRQARKRLARAEAERQAQENRVRFGQTKAEKLVRRAEETRERNRLEASRIEPKPPQPATTKLDPNETS
jgi:hypothetical protein